MSGPQRFYTTERIGEKRRKTPEGFLICEDAVLARTGQQIYGPGETPIDNGDSPVTVDRNPEEVFSPEAIASAQGKPLCDEHPPEDVTPDNWRDYAKGWIINPRRGSGSQNDLMLGDLVVADPGLIAELESSEGRRELSCGYDAEYEEAGPGQGRQKNIRINHVALVDEGRCGPRCSIGDRAPQRRRGMASIRDYLLRAFKAKDAKELDRIESEAAAELPDGLVDSRHRDTDPLHVHIHANGEGAPRIEGAGNDAEPGGEMPAWFKRYAEQNDRRMKDVETSVASALKKWAAEEGDEPEHRDAGPEGDEPEQQGAAEEGEAQDVEGYMEGGEFHPIRSSKGYKRTLGGDPRKRRRRDSAHDAEEEEARRAEEEAPEHEKDRARGARDSAFLADTFQETAALAEIIAPGVAIPAFDGKMSRKRGLDTLCALRKRALDAAYATEAGRGLIQSYLGSRASYDRLPTASREMRGLFLHAASMRRAENAAALQAGRHPAQDRSPLASGGGFLSLTSPAAMNERAAEIFGHPKH